MGRSLTSSSKLKVTANINGLVSTNQQIAGFLGVFGAGRWLVFNKDSSFIVPSGVTKVRVRVVGGGGSALGSSFGGAGGGYAHGVFNVNPGETFPVTVGVGGVAPTPFMSGGTSSFGSLISATGGGISLPDGSSPIPGIGIGGDFQARGGTSVLYGGGGAAGSQLGDGGSGLCEQGGGGGVGGNDALGRGGASAFGSSFKQLLTESGVINNYDVHAGNNWRNGAPDITGKITVYSTTVVTSDSRPAIYRTEGAENNLKAPIRFPFDGFTGGGGCMLSQNTTTAALYTYANILGSGGNGAGGGGSGYGGSSVIKGGDGGVGGGGGASYAPVSETISGGLGGIGGGAGSSKTISTSTNIGTPGGPGIVIVEW